ncbi:calcium-translocating P-type ATPase, PMCA-type family protein [Tritrichomonas foetus]|uniref:Calcium-transporting ATPase n=1 Tax=Tritrichomonas foetus TaxID=1144522 RepID=A0A1J4JKI1_9EUKA|nr:calcium-translocating P-type ATPase, PMCA-type family protein [Tritrichomonas foetus]|eukprot:OHS98911.1 calcium-translocating P-type ATPase, PMCA-type family protein [Tritrichomonas foetus]
MTIPINNETISELFERQNMELFHSMGGLEALVRYFGTDVQFGLSKEEMASNFDLRKKRYGINLLPDPPTKSWWRMFWEAFQNLTLQILVVAAVITLVLNAVFSPDHGGGSDSRFLDFIDPISIFVAVIVVAGVQAQTNHVQQNSFVEINKLKNTFNINVIRAGEETQIVNTDLLVGDILSLKNGDRVASDCIYIGGHTLKIDNSQETGESVAVEVTEENPFVLGGAAVESGDGHLLVCAVGQNSQSGINMMKIQKMSSDHVQSPLEHKLERVSIIITWIGLGGALLTFLCLLIIWLVDIVGVKWEKAFLNRLIENLMVGVTIFICAVPESLPLAVTLSLGLSMKWMVKDNIFVRHLNSCETMGGATTICSDKTGTLTQNNMTVVKFFMNGKDSNDGKPDLPPEIIKLLCESIAINTSAYMTPPEDGKPGRFVGQSSECALLQMVQSYGQDYKLIRDQNPIVILHEFNSTRKRMSTVVDYHDNWRVYVKGAPDYVLQRCTQYITEDGAVHSLDEDIRNSILDTVIDFANEALRTILIAYADLESFEMNPAWFDPDNVECNLTMIGIAGIMDPLRPEVPNSIRMCKKAGVMVRMVTGDYINTAKAIAKNCGILTDDGVALSGLEFSAMSKLELLPMLPKLQVLARSSPRDKYRLVGLLMESGEVVAVTGDGSNDSPAMKRANVGLAMGKCGTELAKMASDIVILDDDFSSIVVALKWGRCIYDNVRGFLMYQLTVNLSAMIVAFVGSCALKTSPLKAIQLLWTNLIVGAIGALALATNKPRNALLEREPYGETDPIISNIMYRNIIGVVLYELFVLFFVLFGYEKIFGFQENDNDTLYTTLVFNTFIYCNIFNLINFRITGAHMSIFDGLLSNYYFDVIFILLAGVQVILVQFAGTVFVMTPLNWKQWIMCVGFGIGIIPLGFILRAIKLPDRTAQRLIANRELKKLKMEELYQGMSAEQMWNLDNTPDKINQVEIDP